MGVKAEWFDLVTIANKDYLQRDEVINNNSMSIIFLLTSVQYRNYIDVFSQWIFEQKQSNQ